MNGAELTFCSPKFGNIAFVQFSVGDIQWVTFEIREPKLRSRFRSGLSSLSQQTILAVLVLLVILQAPPPLIVFPSTAFFITPLPVSITFGAPFTRARPGPGPLSLFLVFSALVSFLFAFPTFLLILKPFRSVLLRLRKARKRGKGRGHGRRLDVLFVPVLAQRSTMASGSGVALPLRKAFHGSGRAVVDAYGETAHFSELSFTYPLKLIAPRMITSYGQEAAQRTSILYMLSYGGGLVGGDKIELDIHVGANTKLVALTQVTNVVDDIKGMETDNFIVGINQSLSCATRESIVKRAAWIRPSRYIQYIKSNGTTTLCNDRTISRPGTPPRSGHPIQRRSILASPIIHSRPRRQYALIFTHHWHILLTYAFPAQTAAPLSSSTGSPPAAWQSAKNGVSPGTGAPTRSTSARNA